MGAAAQMSVIGLDLGTSRVKAVRFNGDWKAADIEADSTTIHRGASGWSEQDMDQVWAVAARVVQKLAARCPDKVDFLAVTAQGDGCWLVGDANKPVRRAILWNDNRAAAIVDRWEADGTLEAAFRINGCYGASGLAHGQLRWLAEHEPQTLRRARCLLSCGSWIYHQLTGRLVLDESDAANPFLDARTRRYSTTLLELFGLTEYEALLPQVVSGPERVAPLRRDAAEATGLPVGTPIVLAPYDVVATATGGGTTEPGQAFAILGTTLCAGLIADDPKLGRTPNGMTLPGTTDDRWLIAYATMTGTEVLDWSANLLGLGGPPELIELAATAVPGQQPMMLPYLSPAGERSPFRSSSIRGSIRNLSTGQTRADVARAAVEGLTLALKECLIAAGAVDSLALSGGGAQNSFWCQTISNALNVVTIGPDTDEVGARGAVLTAAVDIGIAPTMPDLIVAAVRQGAVYHPDPNEADRLEIAYREFLEARAGTSS
jgi:erythritol kinase